MENRNKLIKYLEYGGVWLFLFLISLVFINTQHSAELYTGIQNQYFVPGLKMAGHEYLQHDWFANTIPLHVSFAYLVAALEKLKILEISHRIMEYGFQVVLLTGVWLTIYGVWKKFEFGAKSNSILKQVQFPLVVFLFFVLSVDPIYPLFRILDQHGLDLTDLWKPLGTMRSFYNHALYGRRVLPAEFAIFILLGLSLLLFERWRAGSFFLGITALFHINFAIHTGIMIVVLLIYLIKKDETKIAWQSFWIFTILAAPNLLHFVFFVFDPIYGAEGNNIVIQYGPAAGYQDPKLWWNMNEWIHLIMILLTMGILWIKDNGVVRWIFLVNTIYVIASLLILSWNQNEFIALLMPYRAGVYLSYVSYLTIITTILYLGANILDRINHNAKFIIPIISIFIVFFSIKEYGLFSPNIDLRYYRENSSTYPYFSLINDNTEITDVILVPWKFIAIRLGAQRSVYVDLFPAVRGSEILEYKTRRDFEAEFYTLDGEQRQDKCKEVDINYYLIETTRVEENEPLIDSINDYALIKCPLNDGQ